jgi:hypothetical protein
VAPSATDPTRGTGLVVVALAVLAVGVAAAIVIRSWLAVRPWLLRRSLLLPVVVAVAAGGVTLATRPAFNESADRLRAWLGGPAEAQRQTIAHQVYAAYRRSDLAAVQRVLERSRVYEPTVHEAAAAFGVDPEVLMGVASAESSFYPRDSHDGGRGLFQITAPPADAVAAARERLRVRKLDPLNQRHNAFVAAATLQPLPHRHGRRPVPRPPRLQHRPAERRPARHHDAVRRDRLRHDPAVPPAPAARLPDPRAVGGARVPALAPRRHLARYEEGSNARRNSARGRARASRGGAA